MDRNVSEAMYWDRKMDEQKKRDFCIYMEEVLDGYYDTIALILKDLEANKLDRSGLGLSIDLLCRNFHEKPGVREFAAYARYDYITQCNLGMLLPIALSMDD